MWLGLLGGLSILGALRAVEVLPEELAEARRWARARFEGVEDLQGIATGLNVVTGYCPIDSCASGGRRNDLETLRRAVPLLRSDYRFEPHGTQGHTYGIASWIPYYGTGVPDTDDYVVRSHWCPCLGIGRSEPRREGLDWTKYHRMLEDWRKVSAYFSGDYYPLTAYSLDPTAWMAWQFDRPDLGEGMVQVFCRAGTIYESARLELRGLDAGADYSLTDLDSGQARRMGGKELMETGLLVASPSRPGAPVIIYRKVR